MNLQQVFHLLQTDNQLNDLEQKNWRFTLIEKPKSMVTLALQPHFIPIVQPLSLIKMLISKQ